MTTLTISPSNVPSRRTLAGIFRRLRRIPPFTSVPAARRRQVAVYRLLGRRRYRLGDLSGAEFYRRHAEALTGS